LVLPNCVSLRSDLLYVVDHETSRITAMSLSDEFVNLVDTGLEVCTLMAGEIDAAGPVAEVRVAA